MSLSEYELRILDQLEHDLRGTSRRHAVRALLADYGGAIALTLAALLAVVLLAVSASTPVAAPLAGALAAIAGYAVCSARQLHRDGGR
jgi:hypothetical protein